MLSDARELKQDMVNSAFYALKICALSHFLKSCIHSSIMQYQNSRVFQWLLQAALRLAAESKGYSDQAIASAADLKSKQSTIYRFRQADLKVDLSHSVSDDELGGLEGRFLNRQDAKRLWDHLSRVGLIEQAVSRAGISKIDLYSHRETANALMAFYGSHESQVARFIRQGIEGTYFCFKPSFRKTGFVVKSRFEIKAFQSEYFEINEHQRSSGIYEADRAVIDENSIGFAFPKSERLWVHLREQNTEQPRVMCFHHKKFAKLDPKHPKDEKITILFGDIIEGVKRFRDGFHATKVVLFAAESDRSVWEAEMPGKSYDANDQLDIYPLEETKRKIFEGRKHFYVPTEISEYLKTGQVSS